MTPLLRSIAALFATLATCALAACATVSPRPAAPPHAIAEARERAPVTILISIDGFRADYLDRGLTPTLSRLAARGVSAAMIPSFPSKTFPNHWAEATGYYPDHNGIVANGFTDPERPDERFTMATSDPFYWNAVPPIWVTAERAGIRAATMFWPGSSVAWGGTPAPHGHGAVDGGERPQDWQAFDGNVTPLQRVNTVLDWLRRPADIRPELVLLYFDAVDGAGHAAGPDSAEVNAALRAVDGDIARLLAGLATLGQPANIVVTADHGMAQTSGARVIALDDLLDPADYTLADRGPFATFTPAPGREGAVARALLAPHDHMECWRKAEIPARFHYGTNRRIPPFLCLARTGWLIAPTAPRGADAARIGGNHGYDNRAPEMAALFIASGPDLRRATRLPPFENVDVNPLIRALLGLPQDRALDGRLAPVAGALASREDAARDR